MSVTEDSIQPTLQRDGVLGPIRVLSVREATLALSAFQAQLDAHWATSPGQPPQLAGLHRDVTWAWTLANTPAVTSIVEKALGAACTVWASEVWVKGPYSAVSVPWHQDEAFWPSGGMKTLTAWIALTEASSANGGLSLVLGSHGKEWEHQPVESRTGGLDHEVAPGHIAPENVWTPTLTPGQALFFDARTLHYSPANPSFRARVAFSLRYARVGT